MPTIQYIGSRYVPMLADPVEWSSTKTYEPLTIVTHEGNSYTSRQFVPVGIDIANGDYWALTGNYNAQIELYRQETAQAVETARQLTDDAVEQVDEWLTDAQNKYSAKAFSFDTVSEMQSAFSLLYAGALCHTNGFHEPGDGGAAWYLINTVGTANGRDIIACGATYKANLIITGSFVTPEMYGARGNGINDDTDMLQACIKNKNNIVLTKKYLITRALNFNNVSDVTITGGCVTRPANTTFNTVYGYSCRNISIKNVIFEGNGNERDIDYQWKDNVQACIILANQCKDVSVEKCTINNFNYGIFILGADVENAPTTYENTSYNGVIRDCVFHNCKSPIDTYGKSILIDHNVFYTTTGSCIQIEPNYTMQQTDNPMEDPNYYTSAFSCVISNNLIIDTVGTAIAVINYNSYGISIFNNTIVDFAIGITVLGKGINIYNNNLYYQKPQTIDTNSRPWNVNCAISATDRTVTIRSNYIWKADVGIFIRGGVIATDNIVDSPRYVGITVYTTTARADDIIIVSNNKIQNFVRNQASWYGARALTIGNAKNLFIENNVIDADGQPIHVESNATAKIINLFSAVTPTEQISQPANYSAFSN